MLRRHASQGPVFYAGAIMLGITAFVVLTADTGQFSPGWYDPINTGLTLACLLVPITAGVGAVEGQAMTRTGISEVALASPSGQSRTSLMLAFATAAWPLASVVLANLYLLASAQESSASKAAAVPLAFLGISILVAAALVGVALGLLYLSRLLPGVVAIGAFSLIYVPTLQSGWLTRLSPLDDGTIYRVFIQPNAAVLLEQSALFAGVGVVAGAFLVRKQVRAVTLVIGAAVTTAAVGALTQGSVATTQFRTPPDQPTCVAQNVCVWPEHEYLLPELSAEVALVERAAAGLLPQPTVWAEPGLAVEAESGLGIVSLPERSPSQLAIRDAVAIASVPEPPCRPAPDTEDAYDAYFALRAWIAARLALMDVEVPQVQRSAMRLVKKPESEQKSWVARKLQAMKSGCPS